MIELYNQDCITGMQEVIRDKSVDLIITSPPYNIGTKYKSYKDSGSRAKYLDFQVDILNQFNRILSEDGSIFYNISGRPIDPMLPFEVLNIFLRCFKLQNVFHWVKNITIKTPDFCKSYGHFKPINSDRFVNDCHEYIFHFTQNGNVKLDRKAIGVTYEDRSNITRWSNGKYYLRCRGNNWYIPYDTVQSKKSHPATFPVTLPKNCMLLHGVGKTNVVLDPFSGIGTTGIAAKELGLDYIGFEIDKDYYQESVERLKDEK